jgi:transcriptional regulator with XRE-family HTH domain
MNILTKMIRNKGYTLTQFCDVSLISLRTYRRWEKNSHAMHDRLISKIDELEGK